MSRRKIVTVQTSVRRYSDMLERIIVDWLAQHSPERQIELLGLGSEVWGARITRAYCLEDRGRADASVPQCLRGPLASHAERYGYTRRDLVAAVSQYRASLIEQQQHNKRVMHERSERADGDGQCAETSQRLLRDASLERANVVDDDGDES